MVTTLCIAARGVLLRIGLIRLRDDGSIRWPIHVANRGWWKIYFGCLRRGEWFSGRAKNGRPRNEFPFGFPFAAFVVFRNLPGVIKWEPGRLLPRRWGVQILGIEIGDRG